MMKKQNEMDNILDECLERVFRGEHIETILADYPDHVDELRPLLMTVVDTKSAMNIRPRAEFRDRASYQFQNAIRELGPVKRRGWFAPVLRPAWVTAIIAVVLLAGASGTVAASGNSLPGEMLYPVKTATEQVRLTFAGSDETKAELYVKFTNERVDEVIRLAERGDAKNINNATDRLEEYLVAMVNLDIAGDEVETAMLQKAAVDTETAFDAAEAPREAMLSAPAPTPAPEPTSVPAPAQAPAPGAVPEPEHDVTAEERYEAVAGSGESLPMITVPKTALEVADDALTTNIRVWGEIGAVNDGLKVEVANSAVANSKALQDLLDKVNEDVREALLRTIEVTNSGYSNAIGNID
jgi:hypothetical protein